MTFTSRHLRMSGFFVAGVPRRWKSSVAARSYAVAPAFINKLMVKSGRRAIARLRGRAMTDLSKRRILIVEDEILIALFLEEILEELGCVVIGIATGREEGLELIDANLGALDATMLDINLGDDTTSHDLAAALAAAGVPFIVTTGYDEAPQLVGLESRPRLEKPYDKDGVARALRLLYRTGNDAD